MARQLPKWEPGTAANAFVRSVLSGAGTFLGGLSDAEWATTRAFFDGCDAYTGEPLHDDVTEGDHAVPMNREHCGLHLFGNVLPISVATNRAKGSRHFREFVTDQQRLARVEAFRVESGYESRIAVFGNLGVYLRAQYDMIDTLARVARRHLAGMLPVEPAALGAAATAGTAEEGALAMGRRSGPMLPILLDPASEPVFKAALLKSGVAWISTHYMDGRCDVRPWNLRDFSAASNLIGNLRTRPKFRQGAWQAHGITKVLVSIRKP